MREQLASQLASQLLAIAYSKIKDDGGKTFYLLKQGALVSCTGAWHMSFYYNIRIIGYGPGKGDGEGCVLSEAERVRSAVGLKEYG